VINLIYEKNITIPRQNDPKKTVMNRTKVIQSIINKINAKTYLEIGVAKGVNFIRINASKKIGVDPKFKLPEEYLRKQNESYYEIKSDEFFRGYKKLLGELALDVVFIDGLHTYEQSLKDVNNSLEHLSENGIIIMHDCNPKSKAAAQKNIFDTKQFRLAGDNSKGWNGDVYKTIINLRSARKDLNIFVLNFDEGLGIIKKGKPENLLNYSTEEIDKIDYQNFSENREQLLNLKEENYFTEFIKKLTEEKLAPKMNALEISKSSTRINEQETKVKTYVKAIICRVKGGGTTLLSEVVNPPNQTSSIFPKVTLAACAKNESPYLLEWVAHHKLLGFDRIIIYTNDNTDGSDELLAKMQKYGLIDWRPRTLTKEQSPQHSAFAALSRELFANQKEHGGYLIWFDLDEFLVLKMHSTVKELLKYYNYPDGLFINWKHFGSAGEELYRPELTIKRFLRCDSITRHNKQGKCFSKIDPNLFSLIRNHRPLYKNTQLTGRIIYAANKDKEVAFTKEAGDKKDIKDTPSPIFHEVAQLNHYSIRSRGEFSLRSARGDGILRLDNNKPVYQNEYFLEHDLNNEIDTLADTKYTNSVKNYIDSLPKELKEINQRLISNYLKQHCPNLILEEQTKSSGLFGLEKKMQDLKQSLLTTIHKITGIENPNKKLTTKIIENALFEYCLTNSYGVSVLGVTDSTGNLLSQELFARIEKMNWTFFKKTPSSQPEILPGKYIFAGYLREHYGHFLLEGLSRIWYIKKNPDLPIIWISLNNIPLTPMQEEMLNLFNLKNKQIIIQKPTIVEKLIVPEPGFILKSHLNQEQAKSLVLYDAKGIEKGKKVWLSRSKLNPIKVLAIITNENKLEKILANKGWTIFHPEEHPIANQIKMLSSAEQIAGFKGSAFHTLVFLDNVKAKITIFDRTPSRKKEGIFPNQEIIAKIKKLNQTEYSPSLARTKIVKIINTRKGREKGMCNIKSLDEIVKRLEKNETLLSEELVKNNNYGVNEKKIPLVSEMTNSKNQINNFSQKKMGETLVDAKVKNYVKAIICGFEGGGTTLLSEIVKMHPTIEGGFEGGFLLCKTPREFSSIEPPYADNLKKFWQLSDEEVTNICNTDEWSEVYRRLREKSPLIKNKNAFLIDKTPRYMRFLSQVLKKAPGVPVIVITRDPRAVFWTTVKREYELRTTKSLSIEEFANKRVERFCERYNNYSNAYVEAIQKGQGDRILLVRYEDLCSVPTEVLKKVFGHIGLDYLETYKQFGAKENNYPCHLDGISNKFIEEFKEHLSMENQEKILNLTKDFEQWNWTGINNTPYSTQKDNRVLVLGLIKTGTSALYTKIRGGMPPTTTSYFEPIGKNLKDITQIRKDMYLKKNILIKEIFLEWYEKKGFKTADEYFSVYDNFNKKVLIIRDPRDRFISALLFHFANENIFKEKIEMFNECVKVFAKKRESPSNYPVKDILNDLSKIQGYKEEEKFIIKSFLSNNNNFFEFIKTHKDFFKIKYEDLIDGNVKELEDYLGFKISLEAELEKKWEHVARTKKYGDWKNWFTPEDVEYFKPLLKEAMQVQGYDFGNWTLNEKQIINQEHCDGYVEYLGNRGHNIQNHARNLLNPKKNNFIEKIRSINPVNSNNKNPNNTSPNNKEFFKMFESFSVNKKNMVLFSNKEIESFTDCHHRNELRFKLARALPIHKSNAVCTFIQKNACSTLRYSIAIENGLLKGNETNLSIVNMPVKLATNLNQLLNPPYSFVILRCPYTRLTSAFFEKFVRHKPESIHFLEKYFPNKSIDDLTFSSFINTLHKNAADSTNFDMHWRPQTNFLLYKNYTKYFSVEEMDFASKTLEKDIGLKIHDTRSFLTHHTYHLKKISSLSEPWNIPIKQLKKLDGLPTTKSMFSEELVQIVKNIYSEDIKLYKEKLGDKNLTFK